MNSSRFGLTMSLIGAALALNACNSSNSEPAPIVPAASPTPTATLTVPATGGTVTSVFTGGSATIVIPAASAAITTTVTSSTTAPTGTTAITAGTPIIYSTITPSASATYTTGGVVSGAFTSTSALSSTGTYSLELYAPTQGWLVDPTPGTISGNTLTFTYTLPNAVPVLPVTYDIAIVKTS